MHGCPMTLWRGVAPIDTLDAQLGPINFREEREQLRIAIANRFALAGLRPAHCGLGRLAGNSLWILPADPGTDLIRVEPEQNIEIAVLELTGPMAVKHGVQWVDQPVPGLLPIVGQGRLAGGRNKEDRGE